MSTMTVSEALAQIEPVLTAAQRRTYARYLALMGAVLGDRDVAGITPLDVEALAVEAQRTAVRRRHGSIYGDGVEAAEHQIAICRTVLARCLRQGWVDRNVALLVPKPRRNEPTRTALSQAEVNAVVHAAAVPGRGYETVIRYLLETGCRRAGLLGLAPKIATAVYLPDLQAVEVREKRNKRRILPVSTTLAAHLERPDSVLYAMTQRKLETLWGTVRTWCPRAAELGVSCHWLRHTAATAYERSTGSYSLTAAWLGHSIDTVTSTYIRHTRAEIAHGWHLTFGEEHPMCEH